MSPHRSTYRFCITADADSTLLARAADILACLDLVPEHLHLQRKVADSDLALLATLLVCATARQADLLVRKMQQITLVHAIDCERMPGNDVLSA